MASLRKKGDRWHIRWYDSSRSPSETVDTFSADAWTKTDLKAHKRELEVQYEKGEYDPWTDPARRREPTLSEAMEEYINEKTAAGARGQQGGWTESTRQGKESVLRDFASAVDGTQRVSDVTQNEVRRYVDAEYPEQDDLALATRKGYRTHINAFLRWVDQQGHEVPDPIPPLKKEMPDPEYVTEEELYAICEAHCDRMDEVAGRKHVSQQTAYRPAYMTVLWRFAFYEGLRRSELVALRPRDINQDSWMLKISAEQKGQRPTTIPVTPPARRAILPLLEGHSGSPQTRLFGVGGNGSYVTEAFKRAVRRTDAITDELRIERLSLHSLRHSCAVYWRQQGVSLADIRDLLRHKSIRTTEVYDKMVPSGLKERFAEAA